MPNAIKESKLHPGPSVLETQIDSGCSESCLWLENKGVMDLPRSSYLKCIEFSKQVQENVLGLKTLSDHKDG